MKTQGLTLMELLVVIGVVVIMGGIFVANYDPSEEAIDLLNEKNAIVQNIVKAREMAMSRIQAEEDTNYGIGLWFGDPEGKEYYIYRNNETLDSAYGYNAANDIILQKVSLGSGINYVLEDTNKGILFVPPEPYVVICEDADCLSNDALFGISVCQDEKCKLIRVNALGLVEEINE